MRSSRTRKGIGLVEVVVILFVVLMLVALLLPSVQCSREAARRTQCKNNLKQIGLALHNYHDTYLQFPIGSLLTMRADDEGFYFHESISWGYQIIPFLECGELYSLIEVQDDSENHLSGTYASTLPNLNTEYLSEKLPVYLCPSTAISGDSRINLVDMKAGSEFMGIPLTADHTQYFGQSDYIATAGVRGALNQSVMLNEGEAGENRNPAGWADISYACPRDSFGEKAQSLLVEIDALKPDQFGVGADNRMESFLDGVSNTVLVAESAARNEVWRRGRYISPDEDAPAVMEATNFSGGGWADPLNVIWLAGSSMEGTDYTGVIGVDQVCVINCTNERHPESRNGFYSFHPSGTHFLFADGAVRFLAENTSNSAISALLTKSGREKIDTY